MIDRPIIDRTNRSIIYEQFNFARRLDRDPVEAERRELAGEARLRLVGPPKIG